MTADDSVDPAIAEGTDRRTALKKAAIAAGVVAWTTPAVQAVTARPAFAQTVTACAAAASAHPGHPDRPELQAVPGRSSASELLQRQHVLLATSRPLAVRAARGTPSWATSRSPAARSPATATSDRFLDDACKTATVTITSAKVKCADGDHVHDHQSGRPDHVHRLRATSSPTTELSTTDVIEDELIEQPPDTVTDEGGGTDHADRATRAVGAGSPERPTGRARSRRRRQSAGRRRTTGRYAGIRIVSVTAGRRHRPSGRLISAAW